MIAISTLAIFFTLNHHSFPNNMKQVLMHANMHQDSKNYNLPALYLRTSKASEPSSNTMYKPSCAVSAVLSFSLFRIIICNFVFLFTICISVKIRSSYCFTLATFGVVTGFRFILLPHSLALLLPFLQRQSSSYQIEFVRRRNDGNSLNRYLLLLLHLILQINH